MATSCVQTVVQGSTFDAFTDHWNTWQTVAQDAVAATNDILDGLETALLGQLIVTADYEKPTIEDVEDFIATEIDTTVSDLVLPTGPYRPSLPAIPPIDFQPLFPDAPPDPGIAIGPAPDTDTVVVPDTPPDSPVLVYPDEPTITYPSVPTFDEIGLPTLDPITLPTIDPGDFPQFSDIAGDFAPLTDHDYVEPPYVSELEQPLIDKILEWLLGGTGLPPWLWDAIWEKERANEEETGLKLVQEAMEDFAARGFELPPGPLASRVQQAHEQVNRQVNTRAREVAIQYAQMEVDNIRHAMQQGIVLEGQLKDHFHRVQDRLLRAAIATLEASISVYNAFANVYNTQVLAYRVAIEANNIAIQQELAKLEVYKGELDAARIQNEINRLDVEIYTQQLQGVLARIQVYKAQLEAVQTEANVYATEVGAFKTTVEAAAEQIRANNLVLEGYKAELDGEKAKSDVYANQVRAYAAQIDAVSSEGEYYLKANDQTIDIARFEVDYARADISRYSAELQAQLGKIQAEVAAIDAQAKVLTANAGVQEAQARIGVEIQKLRALIEKYDVDAEIATAKIVSDYGVSLRQLAVSGLTEAAKVQGSIASSALSAISMSRSLNAGVSDSLSISKSDC